VTETLLTLTIREKFDGTGQSIFQDRIENFNDYYPCMKSKYNTFLVNNWIQFFVWMYNYTTFENYFINELNNRGEYILS
jgi:hypothetical protein